MDVINREKVAKAGTNIMLFAGQILVLLLCIVFISFFYTENIAPDKHVAEDFSQTTCLIFNKSLATHGHLLHQYRADFMVSYSTVEGVPYRSLASANGLDFSFTSDKDSQQEFLTEFNVGNTYPCWYDPQKPRIVVLVLRHSWTSTMPLLVPSLIAIVMLYYIFRAVINLLEAYVRSRPSR